VKGQLPSPGLVKLSYKIDTGLKTITTSIQKFGEVVVESKPSELTFDRKKYQQAQVMVADLSPPMSVENIQLKLKQKINIKGNWMRGCSLSIIDIHLLLPNPDDTATLLLSLI
jgi:hypothetical protein